MILYPISALALIVVLLAVLYVFWYDKIKSRSIILQRELLDKNSFSFKFLNFITGGKDRISLFRALLLIWLVMLFFGFCFVLINDPVKFAYLKELDTKTLILGFLFYGFIAVWLIKQWRKSY